MKTTFAVHWQYGVATHSGLFQTTNEDRSLLRIGVTDQGEPYAAAAIADGMGGSGDGGMASETALAAVKLWLDEQLPGLLNAGPGWKPLAISAERLFHSVNGQLIELGKRGGRRIGTTLTLILLLNETYYLCHTGDCRVYKVTRSNRVRLLTKDQSWASEQVRKGRLSLQQVRKHPKRHVLLHCLGMQTELKLIARTGFYTPNDRFLLCSDGFYDRVTDLGIERILKAEDGAGLGLQPLCDLLLDRALDRQSNDNISVLMLRPAAARITPWRRFIHRCKNFYMLFPVEWRK
ncbi:PP2C family protein-serine/threonine phosphatase [Paenibacillus piri]|uniref:PP2C family protein-serine/threonine phosphatase n=1 Tax=Paenibacillus piri TaxID=2547395 RepID=UPI00140544BB|nr:PP2C family serine/threonine-protein phosphatase [Paenibacillus piri]